MEQSTQQPQTTQPQQTVVTQPNLIDVIQQQLSQQLAATNKVGEQIANYTGTIQESIHLTKLKLLQGSAPFKGVDKSNVLYKDGTLNSLEGTKAVANSNINSLVAAAKSIDGSKPKEITEATDPNFGKVSATELKLTGTHPTNEQIKQEAQTDRVKLNNTQKGLDSSHFNVENGPGHLDKPGIAILKQNTLSNLAVQRRLKGA